MDLAERDRLDQEFVDEYIKLCKKYKRKFWVDHWETFNVEGFGEEGDDEYIFVCGVKTRAEQEEQRRICEEAERKRKEAQQREWEEQHRKAVEAYVAGGGTLDENGNIPVSPNYCQLIEWRINR